MSSLEQLPGSHPAPTERPIKLPYQIQRVDGDIGAVERLLDLYQSGQLVPILQGGHHSLVYHRPGDNQVEQSVLKIIGARRPFTQRDAEAMASTIFDYAKQLEVILAITATSPLGIGIMALPEIPEDEENRWAIISADVGHGQDLGSIFTRATPLQVVDLYRYVL
ncbi:hypothetical protein KGQ71_02275, partial [Patescibacteria group bacterium]|nr:hypothetical protein [Patescibacteria group bacterium]